MCLQMFWWVWVRVSCVYIRNAYIYNVCRAYVSLMTVVVKIFFPFFGLLSVHMAVRLKPVNSMSLLEIVTPFHTISFTIIIVIMIWKWADSPPPSLSQMRMSCRCASIHAYARIDCYWLWLGRFFALTLRRTTYKRTHNIRIRKKRRKIAHNFYIMYTFLSYPKWHVRIVYIVYVFNGPVCC